MIDTAQKELESEFGKLATLNHTGMALMQFAQCLYHSEDVSKDPFGVYSVGYGRICFSFPVVGDEKIVIILSGFKSEEIRDKETEMLPGGMLKQMALKDNESGFACFEVSSPDFLGQAAVYIKKANRLYLCSRIIPPEGQNRN